MSSKWTSNLSHIPDASGSAFLAVHRLQGRGECERVMALLRPLADVIEASARENAGLDGYCRGCGSWVRMAQPPTPVGDWANLMEGMLCSCGLNGRMRGILAAVDALSSFCPTSGAAAVFERITPMFAQLQRRFPGLSGSEFLGPEFRPGEGGRVNGIVVRHESILEPSYADQSLDVVLHFDVLEHVPDPLAALSQCHRILKPGGYLLFSCPFYEELEASIVRARIVNGALSYDLPPCYHGNPVDGSGALVFTQFGWDLLDTLAASGFDDLEVWLNFNPVEGVLTDGCPYPDGHAWPICFVARKKH